MADDITLTVRVRDLTRGDFNRVRQQMRGMDGDIRRLAQTSTLASDRSRRLGQEINGVTGRLGQLARAGSIAGHEMTYMRRTMGLLGRDLNNARRAGELSREEFGALSQQLNETRVGFDRLARDVERHSAVARRAAQQERQRQRQAQADLSDAARAEARRQREEAAARRRAEAEARRQQREAERRNRALVQMRVSLARQAARDEAAAQREADRIRARLQRDRERSAREEARRLREVARAAAQAQQRDLARLRNAVGSGDVTLGIRTDDSSLRRLSQSLSQMQRSMAGASTTTASAGRNVRLLGRDMGVLSRVLQAAQEDGSLARRDFDLLAGSLSMLDRSARQAARSGEITRGRLREIRRELGSMRSQLRLMGDEGSLFDRLGARLHVFQMRMHDANSGGGRLRRTLSGVGEGAAGGLRNATAAVGVLSNGFRRMTSHIQLSQRWTAILIASMVLIGPIAQALGALLVTALGGAFIALGAFALRGSEQVKSAFKDMRSIIGSVMREAAKPLQGPLVEGMQQVAAAFREMGPALAAAFSATAPLVKDFVGAFTDLANMSMPGIITALMDARPVMEGFRTALSQIGKGIGEMFAAMTAGGGAEALKNVWVTLGVELKTLLVTIGEFINFAAQSESVTMLLIGVFRALGGVLKLVELPLRGIDMVLGGLLGKANRSITGFDDLGNTFLTAGQSVEELKKQLADVDKEIAKIQESRKGNKDNPFGEIADMGLKGKLSEAQEKRKALTDAIAAAEANAASQTGAHASAVDRLRESIRQLNEQNLSRFDAQARMEQAVADAMSHTDEYTEKLRIQNGMFDLTHEASRKVYEDMSRIARETAEAAKQAEEANAPMSEINAIWGRGRTALQELGAAYNIPKGQLADFINLILSTPESVTSRLEVEKRQAEEAIAQTKKRLNEVNGKKAKAQAVVEHFRAMERLSMVESKLNGLNGRTANTYVYTHYRITGSPNVPDGTYLGSTAGRSADGNIYAGRSFANGGMEQHVAQIAQPTFRMWAEPETGGEAYIPLAQTKRPRSTAILAQVADRFGYRLQEFAKGGVTKSEREARKAATGELTISHFGRKAGNKNTEFVNQLAKADVLKDLVSSLNKWRGIIKKATHGGVERRLLGSLDKASKSLIKYQKQHDAISKTLEKAKALRDSVASGLKGEANITKGAGASDSRVTINTLLSNMTASAGNTKQFASMLDQLRKKGLSGELIKQIAEAGIEGGGMETAAAILGGGKSEIKRLNELQKEINKYSKEAGNKAADAMYGAGLKAGEGVIAGLEKKQKAIEKAMMKIAKAMEKAIKKALGIKSPSRVMERIGQFTAEGFQQGMEKHNAFGVLEKVLPTAGSSGPPRGLSPSPGTLQGQNLIIRLDVGGRNLGELIIDPIRRAVSHRGGNVQAVLGS